MKTITQKEEQHAAACCSETKNRYICISEESEGTSPDTLFETLPKFMPNLRIPQVFTLIHLYYSKMRTRCGHGKSKTPSNLRSTGFSVPRTGIEPARLAAHAPETCASTYSATWALYRCFPELRCAKVTLFSESATLFPKKIYLLKNLY